jgi:elongation factor Ts
LDISVDTIKELRAQTGAGIMDCKRALEQADGDVKEAEEILKQEGIASASKKAERTTNQGLIESYLHSGGRIGALVEVNCETDFVARTPDFRSLAHDLAMQVAAMSPVYIDGDDIPEDKKEELNPQEACLMQQPFIKDPTKTIQDLVKETVGKLGENVRIRKFARFSLGE